MQPMHLQRCKQDKTKIKLFGANFVGKPTFNQHKVHLFPLNCLRKVIVIFDFDGKYFVNKPKILHFYRCDRENGKAKIRNTVTNTT